MPFSLFKRFNGGRLFGCSIAAGMLHLAAPAQNLLPNPGFEEGRDQPAGWRLAEGTGAWSDSAHQGSHGLTVEGNGENQSFWRAENLPLRPNALYRFEFFARLENGAGAGTVVSGPARVNRDFRVDETWRRYRFIASLPADSPSDFVRLGQWHLKGRVSFDDVLLTPVLVTHSEISTGTQLGEGESIREGVYRFSPKFGGAGANYHRPLFLNRANFNSDRWVFGSGSEVIYRLGVNGGAQKSAKLRLSINHYVAGTLRAEASRDGAAWTTIGEFDGQQRSGERDLPERLFPAPEIFIRLSCAGPNGSLQVNAVDYTAVLSTDWPNAEGETHFLDVLQSGPELGAELRGLRPSDDQGRWRLQLSLTNRSSEPITVRGRVSLDSSPATAVAPQVVRVAAGQSRSLDLTGPDLPPGQHLLNVSLTDDAAKPLFAGRTEAHVGFLSDRRPGYRLPGTFDLGLWWCESGWKIGRERAVPDVPMDGRAQPVSISAAQGEYEAVQVILRPKKDAELLSAKVGPLRNSAGATAPMVVRLDEVAYLHVTQPTDASCLPGWYPDPLPPLRTPLKLQALRNQPLWLTFHVSRDVAPGDYQGELEMETTLGSVRVPLAVHVYDFMLPEETHLKSALGLGSGSINRYHRLSRAADREAVFEKYLRNFADHRISPYSFFEYAPMEVRFVGEGADKAARVDFTRFDQAAARWLDEFHFSTFRLPLRGMGGGTFHSRHLGELEGFKEGTPEHARLFRDYLSQVERHLRERGWLDKAFTYWFDEPDPKDYEFVVAGMKRIKDAAPGLRRMLTEQPEPALLGQVEIWCGLTPEWTPEKVRARREAGEEVWWYICTGPKAPYVTEFIDHPGTELRLWPWQSWQYGVNGILIWATIYWTSPAAFPSPKLQDPWTDPMSYVSGYSYGAGQIGHWGNGDGRFLYPPRLASGADGQPCLDDPVNSMRWENLRDGMEDYEYFWLLQQAVERVRKTHGESDLVQRARQLLTVPADVSQDLTHFTTDPRLLLAHRDRVAKMIEALRRGL